MNKYQKRICKIYNNKKILNNYITSDAVDSISYREARKIIKDTVKAFGFWMM